jgi:GPH family glycoside/pentoside/hexuronide:cation symporter
MARHRRCPDARHPRPRPAGFGDQLRLVGADRRFRLLLTTFVVQALATGCMLAGVDYVATWLTDTGGAASVLFACFVAPALVVTPLWQAVGARIGKKRGYVAASLLLFLGAAGAYAARSLPALAVAVAAVGIGYAGGPGLPAGDAARRGRTRRGADGGDRVGVFTGVWTGAETLGLALGPGLYAVILGAGGYLSSSGGAVVQPDSALTAIRIGFTLVRPCSSRSRSWPYAATVSTRPTCARHLSPLTPRRLEVPGES